METRRRRISVMGSKVSLGLSGILVGLFVAELLARLLGPPYAGGDELHACDRMLGWKGKPNTSVTIETDSYQHEVSWNSDGMHDQEHDLKKPEDTFRILILGDSFVEAQQVEEHETNHQVLEEVLNSRAPQHVKFEVISGAIRAWGPAQELIYFRSIGQFYDPDLVVVLWLPANDLTNVLPYDRVTGANGTNCYVPYFALCDGQLDLEPWFPAPGFRPTWKECSAFEKRISYLLNYLYFNSRLYQQLEPILARTAYRVDYATAYAPWLSQSQEDEALRYAYQLTDEIIARLAVESKQVGAKTALVIVPFNIALYSDIESSYREAMQQTIMTATGEAADPTLPNRKFAELMQKRNLPILDLHPYFVEALKAKSEPLYWPADPHWTVAGNRLAGQTIAGWLIDQGLVPVTE